MSLTRGRGRGLLAALTACSLLTTVLPYSVGAEDGIPAGSGAVVTTGAPLLVRMAPGWDSGVSYEIADGSAVTVLDAAQAAVDGSLWYPVDGGFVPVDAVSSVAPAETGFAYFQTVDPAAVPLETGDGWIDPNTGEWVDPSAQQVATEEWVDPATQQVAAEEWVDPAAQEVAVEGWIDPNTGEWVDPNVQPVATDAWVDPATAQVAVEGWIDPNTGEWVDAAAQQVATDTWVDPATQTVATDGWIDPNTGEWVDPATQTVSTEWVDPATQTATTTGWIDPNTGEWVDPAAQQVAVEGWIDPNTGEWVDPNQQVVSLAQEAVTDGVIDPAAEQLVDPASETWQDPAAEALAETPVDPTTAVAETTDLVADQTEWVEPAPVETGVSGDGWSEPIGTAYIAGTNGDGVACRASAERGSDKLAVLGEGEAVEVRGEAVGEWQPVNCAGIGGYVNTSFISWEPVADQQGQGKRNRSRSVGNGGVETASGDGQSMASFAMQYVGYPYVYAGEGPYAFDCSGFTKFVAQNTLGIDITHDMFTQIGMGQSVDQGSLQAGDLVFFANTFRPGLSHTGVYVGGGQFVHAENESTGVIVSDLSSDYYSSRWYGATRLG